MAEIDEAFTLLVGAVSADPALETPAVVALLADLAARLGVPAVVRRPPPSRINRAWTDDETAAVIAGLGVMGYGDWAGVRRHDAAVGNKLVGRSSKDVRDKANRVLDGFAAGNTGLSTRPYTPAEQAILRAALVVRANNVTARNAQR